jgi:ribonucleoside-diphosphate reductase alpha chain
VTTVVAVAGHKMGDFARTILENKNYAHEKRSGRREEWSEVAARVVSNVVLPYLPDLAPRIQRLIEERKFLPGGRYLYASGRKYPQINNCFLLRAHDSREGWGDIWYKAGNCLMTGGGVGVVYSDLREENALIHGMGGRSTGPLALMKTVNEQGRYVRQGGSRRSALWAGLRWNHPDIFKFITMKDWDEITLEGKRRDFNFPAPMDTTNISVILDDLFFQAYGDPKHPLYNLACDVYWCAVRHMLRTGEPGFSVDIGENAGESLRNACTEVTSRDDGDMCNLASLNMPRFRSIEEFIEAVELVTAFLLCGTLYSKLPVDYMYKVREKNRRIGLGLMGLHEWLLRRGLRYGRHDDLEKWISAYTMSGAFAHKWADRLSISRPIATRSIAPTGTISIIAETTSGIEPVLAVAYKRRYLDGCEWKAQYVVDPTAKRLIDEGVDPALIEDSMTLAEDVERRLEFQCWLQEHVDHGISSTINLPPWGSSVNNDGTVTRFGNTLLKHLPRLRGITAYPDGARDGQPLVPVRYDDAVGREGVAFLDASEDRCPSGVCSA